MRRDIAIDNVLTDAAQRAPLLKTKDEAGERKLRTLLRLGQQLKIRKFRGKLEWQGELEQIRSGR